jgi:uncharacterized protein (TIGR03083 family)
MDDGPVHDWRLVHEEREDLLAFFRSLTPTQWETPSLCAGWRIKDVAVHLLIDEPVQSGAAIRVLPMVAKQRFSVHRLNAWWIDQNRQRTTDSIVASFQHASMMREGLLGHILGPAVALRALVIHHQDMRRPLHLNRIIPADRLLVVLDAVLTVKGTISIGTRARARGLRLRATDVRWSHGKGPEVRGSGEAIVMALAGRGAALTDLEGDGKAILAARMPRESVKLQ